MPLVGHIWMVPNLEIAMTLYVMTFLCGLAATEQDSLKFRLIISKHMYKILYFSRQ
jgi:hypothetical protein